MKVEPINSYNLRNILNEFIRDNEDVNWLKEDELRVFTYLIRGQIDDTMFALYFDEEKDKAQDVFDRFRLFCNRERLNTKILDLIKV